MRFTVAATSLAAMSLALAGCGGEPEAAAPPPPVAVEAAVIEAPLGGEMLAAAGVLEREREAALAFRIPGVVTRLTVDAGDRVAQGQVIATVDPAGVQARVARSSVDVEKARRDLARDEQLAARGFVSEQRLQDRRSAVRAAEAAMAADTFDARYARLVSPVTGWVLERRAQAGEVVQAGQAVVVVADDASPLVLRTPVPDREVGRLRPGLPVTVRAAALGERTLAGVVQTVGQRAGLQTGSVEVEVRVPADPALRSGMVARAEIPLGGDAGTDAAFSRAPAEALLEAEGERAFVYRLSADGRTVRRTAVRFGGFDGDHALIAGLPSGTRVVTAGAGFVRDGQRVQVIDPAALATAAPRS
jgi:RND family efflux transporter MFP subunit